MEKLIRLAVIAWSEMRLVERLGPKMTAAAACAAFAFFALLAATGLAVAAMWISIDAASGPVAASLWSSLLFLMIAAALLIAMKFVLSSSPAPRVQQRPAPGLADDVSGLLHKTLGHSKVAAIVSAVVAGLMAGTQRH